MISQYVNVYMKLWYARKPTIAACTDGVSGRHRMVLCADLIIAGESASFGYPPSRVWGTPTPRCGSIDGLERAKRYLLTGDEISAPEAGASDSSSSVPDDHSTRTRPPRERMAQSHESTRDAQAALQSHARIWAGDVPLVLVFRRNRRHTQEGLDFVARATSRRLPARPSASEMIRSATTAQAALEKSRGQESGKKKN